MKQQTYILENTKEVLVFLKSRFPLYHLSNFFFRDVQFGIQAFLERKEMKVGYTAAETIARAFIEKLEHEKLFLPIDRQSWTVNIPEFKKPMVKAPAPAPLKPAAPAARPAAAPAPAVAAAPVAAPPPAAAAAPVAASAPAAGPATAEPSAPADTTAGETGQ